MVLLPLFLWLTGCEAGSASRHPPKVHDGETAGPVDTGVPDDTGAPDDTADPAETGAPPDTGEPQDVDPFVRFVRPADGATVENPVTFEVEARDVATVRITADGWTVCDAWDPTRTASCTYTFSGTGYARDVLLEGLGDGGAVLASDTLTITVESEGVNLDVPYFYQYDNRYEPSGTCGLTSTAMAIDTFDDGRVTPDGLYIDYGKATAQSPDGVAWILEQEGLHADYTLTGTRDLIRSQLDAGRPVVVNGYFTSSGHIVIIRGYTASAWIVNDPAGDWDIGYGDGTSWGEAVTYAYGGAWDDLMSWDGDIWMAVGGTTAFSL